MNIAAYRDITGRPLFSSVFFIKIGFIPVGPEQDVRHPFRRSAHLLTDDIQVNFGTAFDDQFIMNVTDDETVQESFHGVTEDISTDGLHDILNKLRTVGFDTFPFFCGSDSFIGNGFAAELILTNVRLYIGE